MEKKESSKSQIVSEKMTKEEQYAHNTLQQIKHSYKAEYVDEIVKKYISYCNKKGKPLKYWATDFYVFAQYEKATWKLK